MTDIYVALIENLVNVYPNLKKEGNENMINSLKRDYGNIREQLMKKNSPEAFKYPANIEDRVN